MDPKRRLLFWLRIPYLADAVLVLVGTGLLLTNRTVGWWVLLFAAVRAVIGTIALFWLAPRILARGPASETEKPFDGSDRSSKG